MEEWAEAGFTGRLASAVSGQRQVGSELEEKAGRALVIVVDLDDDVGETLGESVIVGYDRVLEAAVRFAIERPDDADANTMFAGLRLYRKLKGEYGYVEIAVVGGSRRLGVEAQRNLRERVASIVSELGPDVDIYIVGDGGEEALASHILRGVGRVAGIESVIVSQHLGIESNYMLIAKYLRKAVTDPHYSTLVLGVPGLVISVAALLMLAGFFSLALKISLLIVGLAMVVYGFKLDDTVRTSLQGFVEELREAPHIRLGGLAVMILLLLLGVSLTYISYVSEGTTSAIVSLLTYTIPLSMAGVMMYIIISRIIVGATEGRVDLSKNIAMLSMLGFTALAFYDLGASLRLVLESGQPVIANVIDAVASSRFIQYIIVGTGLASLTELISRALREAR
ncbi:conserved hypothetical protein [Aeropyrum pernix]|uniref:DUF373 family protein n=1 Tax=Aeropyrum pernix TaxID=56636 RepID=A0A401HA63_AERPX|nr:conserved hypothetical protein [Aeropyrum pernix]